MQEDAAPKKESAVLSIHPSVKSLDSLVAKPMIQKGVKKKIASHSIQMLAAVR